MLFVSHTDTDGNSDVASYAIDGETVDPSTRDVLFEIDQPYANHNGGHIVLGPDGRLWLGLGDGGSADDPENRAQDDGTLLGKLVAIDLDSGEAVQVAKGLRNPWRFDFDDDGGIWIADVGQDATEEIDHVTADEIEGANFGWSGYEGSAEYLDGDGRRPDDAIGPVFEYDRSDGACSVTGGVTAEARPLPTWTGRFRFADYCSGRVRAGSSRRCGIARLDRPRHHRGQPGLVRHGRRRRGLRPLRRRFDRAPRRGILSRRRASRRVAGS